MASSKTRSRNRSAASRNRAAAGRSTAGVPVATPNSPGPRQASQGQRAEAGPRQRAAVMPKPAAPEPASPDGPPLWLQLVSLGLAILGLAVSAYETYAHFTGSHLAGCPTSGHGTFNCTAVITSPQSMVFGTIPVAILGLLFYVFAVAIMTPWAWRMRRREVAWLRLVSMIVGMGFVMYLIYAEIYQIQSVCEYCTGVHVITFLLFCLTVVSAAIWGLGRPRTDA